MNIKLQPLKGDTFEAVLSETQRLRRTPVARRLWRKWGEIFVDIKEYKIEGKIVSVPQGLRVVAQATTDQSDTVEYDKKLAQGKLRVLRKTDPVKWGKEVSKQKIKQNKNESRPRKVTALENAFAMAS